jgi:hypothetical protein
MSEKSQIVGAPGEGEPKPTGIDYRDNPFVFESKPNRRNYWATAGLVFAVLFWPLGLVLSIVGMVKSKKWGDVGQGVATIGLIVALVFAAGTGLYFFLPRNVDYTDPGCMSAKPSLNGLQARLGADNQQASSGPAGLSKSIADLSSLQAAFQQAAAQATHQNVKDAFTQLDTDFTLYLHQLQDLANGASDSQIDKIPANFMTDVPKLDHACGVSG